MQLKQYVPEFLLKSKTFETVYHVQQEEIDALNSAAEDICNQCFIDKATWGLKYWERFLGMTVDETKQVSYRRSAVKAKLRGTGTITVKLIEDVAGSFSNGEVDVIENNSEYGFIIKFTGTKGIPPNLDDLKRAIEEIKPAHLTVQYTFTWLTWDEFDKYNRTCDAWDSLNLTWDELEVYTKK